MKKILMAALVLVLAASVGYAAEQANEPVGQVVEASGVFVGKVTSVVADTMTAGKGTVTVADENGQTKIFPIDDTVKVVDATMNALTFNQLKQGEKVAVSYSGEKADEIKVTK